MRTIVSKTLLTFAVVMALVTFSASCKRRALTTADNNVMVNITIDKDIVNYVMKEPPQLMRNAFFIAGGGSFAAHAFLPSTGGFVNVIPGRNYDLLVYNFGTKSTVINDEYDLSGLYATTNEVSEVYKSKLKSRSQSTPGEKIVFEPDHLFVGKVADAYVPVRGADAPPVVIDVNASTVVQSWKLKVDKVSGKQWIAGVAGVITGLSEGCMLSQRLASKMTVSVFFETQKIGEDGVLEASFNTFGYIPGADQKLSLVITDIAGQGHEFNMDISKQFIDNPEQLIYIKTDKIVIEEPEEGPQTGGGLAPEVDQWQNIENNIEI